MLHVRFSYEETFTPFTTRPCWAHTIFRMVLAEPRGFTSTFKMTFDQESRYQNNGNLIIRDGVVADGGVRNKFHHRSEHDTSYLGKREGVVLVRVKSGRG
jgi:hypothetical protein